MDTVILVLSIFIYLKVNQAGLILQVKYLIFKLLSETGLRKKSGNLEALKTKGMVYCHKYTPSNDYYLKYGGKIIASEAQMDGKLIVNIFEFSSADWAKRIDKALNS